MTPAEHAVASPRQWLTKRQATTVNALLDAGLEELREVGFEEFSVRSVAQRAGVTHTTAYSYFTSKAHLVVELQWRQLQSVPPPDVGDGDSLATRVRKAITGPTMAMADEPELATAILSAALGSDPDIRRVREVVGTDLARRLQDALGKYATPDIVRALLMAYSGAMLMEGVAGADFAAVIPQMESVAALIERD